MTTQQAIETLRGFQPQIIHGKNTFGDLADHIEDLQKIADTHRAERDALQHQLDIIDSENREAAEREGVKEDRPLTDREREMMDEAWQKHIAAAPKAIWRCRRCGKNVDLVAMRCGCTTSPSPWEHVNAPAREGGGGGGFENLTPADARHSA